MLQLRQLTPVQDGLVVRLADDLIHCEERLPKFVMLKTTTERDLISVLVALIEELKSVSLFCFLFYTTETALYDSAIFLCLSGFIIIVTRVKYSK